MNKRYIMLGIVGLSVLFMFIFPIHINISNEKNVRMPPVKIPEMDKKTTADSEEAGETQETEETMDFASLLAVNRDVVAYINIPGTEISYPVLHHQDDDFYLNHNLYGEETVSGELFIENFNRDGFEDPVTIIYGHNMKDGSYFGMLQDYYCDADWFEEHDAIDVYLPGKNLHYKVKAAVPFSSLHILYYYDFTEKWIFNSFMKDVYEIRDLKANFSSGERPSGDNSLLILSTCLDGDHEKRFLVIAEEIR